VVTFGDDVIRHAGKYLGTTYAWGGGTFDGPSLGIRDGGVADGFRDFTRVGFDCSGLVLYAVYQASGGAIRLPHLADIQRTMGQEVPLGQQQPGDIIAFAKNGVRYNHIGIYLGNGMLRNAPQSGGVVSDMPLSTWSSSKQVVRRFGLPGGSTPASSGPFSESPGAGDTGGGISGGLNSSMMTYAVLGAVVIVGLIIVFSQVN
jgi:hypothetical protein